MEQDIIMYISLVCDSVSVWLERCSLPNKFYGSQRITVVIFYEETVQ